MQENFKKELTSYLNQVLVHVVCVSIFRGVHVSIEGLTARWLIVHALIALMKVVFDGTVPYNIIIICCVL